MSLFSNKPPGCDIKQNNVIGESDKWISIGVQLWRLFVGVYVSAFVWSLLSATGWEEKYSTQQIKRQQIEQGMQ